MTKKQDAAPEPTEAQAAILNDLKIELAAVTMSRLDLEAEKKRYVKDMGADIEQLKDRQREIAAEIKAGGRQIPLWGGAEKTETDAGAEKN